MDLTIELELEPEPFRAVSEKLKIYLDINPCTVVAVITINPGVASSVSVISLISNDSTSSEEFLNSLDTNLRKNLRQSHKLKGVQTPTPRMIGGPTRSRQLGYHHVLPSAYSCGTEPRRMHDVGK